jgi:hypothetical protein
VAEIERQAFVYKRVGEMDGFLVSLGSLEDVCDRHLPDARSV